MVVAHHGLDAQQKNRMTRLTSLLAVCLCSVMIEGCSLIETRKTPAPVDEDTLSYSRELVTKGRYSEAIQLLTDASMEKPRNPAYVEELKTLKLQRKVLEEELTDQLLISNTSALQKQLPILEKLTQSSPNHQYQALLEQTKTLLQEMRLALSECGWRHFKRNNELAKECLDLALSLREEAADKNLMEHLLLEQRRSEVAKEKKLKAKRDKSFNKRINTRLAEADRLSESGQLREAKRVLLAILKEAPEHKQAKKMLTKVNSQLQGYIENLLTAGDRLYRDGEIEGAKATWRAILSLDPQDGRAWEKIQRAQRVLDNLENLRRTR
jgi:tetratricopeptide (TPR) repeat protein